jgi:hypothetical protein
MIEAWICEPIVAKDVKCVSPITLAPKAHSSGRMMIDNLQQQLNKECGEAGISPSFLGPPDVELLPARVLSNSGLPPK